MSLNLPSQIGNRFVFSPNFKNQLKDSNPEEWKKLYEDEFSRMEKLESHGGRPCPYRLSILKDRIKGDVLSIGCGDGFDLLKLKELNPDIKCHGVDIIEKAIEIAKKRVDGEFKQCDLNENDVPFDKKFDTVIVLEVLEHLKSPENILKKAWDSCKPGGKVIFTTPIGKNLDHYTHIHHFEYYDILDLCDKFTEDYTVCRIPKFSRSDKQVIFLVEIERGEQDGKK